MAIYVRLNRMPADRKMALNELAEHIGMTNGSLSDLKTGKMKGVRFETLNALCAALCCRPGELPEYRTDDETK